MSEHAARTSDRLEAFGARRIARGRLLVVMAQTEAESRNSSFAIPTQPVELIEAEDEMRMASAHLADLMSFGDIS